MQNSISSEEFARFQSQLLEIKELKYTSDESRTRSEKRVVELEDLLARKSCELAEVHSKMSRIQRAGDIDSVNKDNYILRKKLINLESSFKLQTNTLRSECERLQTENNVLLSTLRVSGETCPPVHEYDNRFTQTDKLSDLMLFTISCQTNFTSENINSYSQTDITLEVLLDLEKNLSSKSEELITMKSKLDDLSKHLLNEEITWGLQYEEVNARLKKELDASNIMKEKYENLCSELEIVQNRNEKVVKELRRQIASNIRFRDSYSSFVCANSPENDVQNKLGTSTITNCPLSDTTSNSSTSLLRAAGGLSNNDEFSETSSMSNYGPTTQPFTEDDFRCLLNRLAEVQEENCIFRRKIKQLSSDLEAKSAIIQQQLDEKLNKNTIIKPTSILLNLVSSSEHQSLSPSNDLSPSNSTKNTTDILSVALSNFKSKLTSLDHISSSKIPVKTSPGLPELRCLKQLCEELMTRNIILESSLEDTLHRETSRVKF